MKHKPRTADNRTDRQLRRAKAERAEQRERARRLREGEPKHPHVKCPRCGVTLLRGQCRNGHQVKNPTCVVPGCARAQRGKGLCAIHYRQRKTLELTVTSPAVTPSAPRPRNDWSPQVRKLAALRSGGVCEICAERPAVHLHHRQLRRHGDHRIVNALHVCHQCHDRIHHERTLARHNGWIVRASHDAAGITVVIAGGGRVLLTEHGDYEQVAA